MGGKGNNNRKSADAAAAQKDETLKVTDGSAIKLMVAAAVKDFEVRYQDEINFLKAQLVVMNNSQQFLSCQYDDMKAECERLNKVNQQQEEEIQKLKSQSLELEDRGTKEEEKVDAIEQYGRRQNLEIAGIPVKPGENTNEIVTEVAKLANVDITADQISTSHRLPPKRSGNTIGNKPTPPPSIIVRFINRDVRNKIYSNRQLLRKIDVTKFSVDGTNNIYLNENLTRIRKQLFWKSKQRAKDAGFKFYWTVNGNIYVKKDDGIGTKAVMIKNEQDLELIC